MDAFQGHLKVDPWMPAEPMLDLAVQAAMGQAHQGDRLSSDEWSLANVEQPICHFQCRRDVIGLANWQR